MKSFQTWCSPECGIVIRSAEAGEGAQVDPATRAPRGQGFGKEKLKSRGRPLEEAQAAFNEFIRWRDWDRPCISCGRFS
ncbi:recombination protein NinG [Pseudomonas aeruginosa]|uniref:recombination protein NinG n=1 Tax=Pseudomonas aeruginosa TaxID=287 RepID=UPI00215D2FB3|nr:recombination protein NinG [Pseudomonas aeruginosa]